MAQSCKVRHRVIRLVMSLIVVVVAVGSGCAGPPPKLFPVAPLQVHARPAGGFDRLYDTNGDERVDYCERLSSDGIITTLGYDTTGDGEIDDEVELESIPDEQCRDLILILDSVPFRMVDEIWGKGRFRFFAPPSRVISPFPVMTDVVLSTFFGIGAPPGIESEFYDGKKLSNGYANYSGNVNVPWHVCTDYYLGPTLHAPAYLWPRAWYDHELRRVQEIFETSKQKKFTAYFVGTSAIGARIGRDGHQAGLVRLDRFCQELMYRTRGRIRLTLLSDHGHNLMSSQRVPLADMLREFGYRVHHALEKPGDVVVPEFGMVTCAAIHSRSPARVARDVVGIDGIELTAYREPTRDDVILLSRDGRARISHKSGRLRYWPEHCDPLKLGAILEQLASQGHIDPDGFVDDQVLFDATADHEYPDAVYRLWQAFHGLVQHTPEVLISVQDGWHCGSATMSSMAKLTAAHGNLHPASSTAFVLTTAGSLPPVIRMADLGKALEQMGVPLRCRENAN